MLAINNKELFSFINTKYNYIRKNNIFLKYRCYKNKSFFIIPVVSLRSSFINELKLLIRKNSLDNVFLKLSFFRSFDFTNQYLVIYYDKISFGFIDLLKLFLINYNFEFELITFFIYLKSYYYSISFNNYLNNMNFLSNINLQFSLISDLIIILENFFN